MASIFDLLKLDLDERDRLGWEQYHKPLLVNDGRDSLRDAYEECLDLCVYLRKALNERDSYAHVLEAVQRHLKPGGAS